MGLRCHELLRIGKLRRMLAWHVGMVGVMAFVWLCAEIALMPWVHIPTLKCVLSSACSLNRCPFQGIFCLRNLLHTCSWYWVLVVGDLRVCGQCISLQSRRHRVWMRWVMLCASKVLVWFDSAGIRIHLAIVPTVVVQVCLLVGGHTFAFVSLYIRCNCPMQSWLGCTCRQSRGAGRLISIACTLAAP
jgi:hypothetical protein